VYKGERLRGPRSVNGVRGIIEIPEFVSVKIVDFMRVARESLINEISIMYHLQVQDGPVATLYEVFEDQHNRIIPSILLFVKYMHDKNVIHRDLKPENLMLLGKTGTDADKVVGIDFGTCAWILDNQDPRGYPLQGTPEYMAPEIIVDRIRVHCWWDQRKTLINQAKSENNEDNIKNILKQGKKSSKHLGYKYSKKTDLWAVGVIIFMLLNEDHFPVADTVIHSGYGRKESQIVKNLLPDYKRVHASLENSKPWWEGTAWDERACREALKLPTLKFLNVKNLAKVIKLTASMEKYEAILSF